ncbi:hypothetical protein [Culicoidibacter larvae]|nr:hypothetical protein [Culicoidibacter larvae]
MKLFGKKEQSKTEKIDEASKSLNKGLSGLMMKAFVGKDDLDKINNSIEGAKMAALAEEGAFGEVAYATVTALQDTGKLVNFDPIVILQLNVIQAGREPYAHQMETLVSKLQIPRVGDVISLGSNPADPTQFIYLGLKQ